jgi:hypothetical protein
MMGNNCSGLLEVIKEAGFTWFLSLVDLPFLG